MTEEQEREARDELIASKKLVRDQREANAEMVRATIRAHEATDDAEAARARAEAVSDELRESEERFRTLFELSPVAVYSCDGAGVILQFNRHAVELWGREPAPGDTDERFCGGQSRMAEVLCGRIAEARDVEVVLERPDGSRATVVENIRPLKNQRGEVIAAINCFYDITARKLADQQLADSLNRERETAAFREMFIGVVGHDLRNPLMSIVMAAALLLRRGRLDDQDAAMATRIIHSSQRMTRLIAQLLDLTRARLGGGLVIEPKPSDMRALCRDVVEEFDAPIRLKVEGDVTGAWDPDRVQEVLSNIVGNAIEHATPGTAVVVDAHADGAEVVVEISNLGNPIPPDVLPFIFEPFRRARPLEKSATGNLGLGLYIACQVVRSHGGTLDARSENGATTFTIRLPRQPERDEIASRGCQPQ